MKLYVVSLVEASLVRVQEISISLGCLCGAFGWYKYYTLELESTRTHNTSSGLLLYRVQPSVRTRRDEDDPTQPTTMTIQRQRSAPSFFLSSRLWYRYQISTILYSIVLTIALLFSIHRIITLIRQQQGRSMNHSDNIDPSSYLYYNRNDSYPVIEHVYDVNQHDSNLYPKFLSLDHDDHYVVVEFYAHWCYHVSSFMVRYRKEAHVSK
jgi:hypothetical protein